MPGRRNGSGDGDPRSRGGVVHQRDVVDLPAGETVVEIVDRVVVHPRVDAADLLDRLGLEGRCEKRQDQRRHRQPARDRAGPSHRLPSPGWERGADCRCLISYSQPVWVGVISVIIE